MPRIRTLSISGYKSIKKLEDFALNRLNVLIGANGAGKSNFIGLFKLINEMYEQRLQLYVQKQGGPDSLLHFGRQHTEDLYIDLRFAQNGYRFWLSPTEDNRLIFNSESVMYQGEGYAQPFQVIIGSAHEESLLPKNKEKISSYVRGAIKTWRIYHFHDTSDTAKVKQIQASNDNLLLKPDAANLAAYLRRLKEDYAEYYDRIVATIRLVLPFFNDFVYREDVGEDMQLEWFHKNSSDTPLKAHVLSDGSLRFICLATLLLQPPNLLPDTLLIDEPELGLHPYAIAVLGDLLKQAAEDTQVIVSTQSVELVNEFEPHDVVVVDQLEGASSFTRLDDENLKDWLKQYDLGELWKQNVLGGRP